MMSPPPPASISINTQQGWALAIDVSALFPVQSDIYFLKSLPVLSLFALFLFDPIGMCAEKWECEKV